VSACGIVVNWYVAKMTNAVHAAGMSVAMIRPKHAVGVSAAMIRPKDAAGMSYVVI